LTVGGRDISHTGAEKKNKNGSGQEEVVPKKREQPLSRPNPAVVATDKANLPVQRKADVVDALAIIRAAKKQRVTLRNKKSRRFSTYYCAQFLLVSFSGRCTPNRRSKVLFKPQRGGYQIAAPGN